MHAPEEGGNYVLIIYSINVHQCFRLIFGGFLPHFASPMPVPNPNPEVRAN